MTIQVDYAEHRGWGVPHDPAYQLRPYIEVEVHGPSRTIRLWCLIDSGADYSVFDEDVATDVGFTFGTGTNVDIGGVAGSVTLEAHDKIDLEMEGQVVQDCRCLFGPQQQALVGRADFLSALGIGFDSQGWLYHT